MPMAHKIQTRQTLFILDVLKTMSNTLLMKFLHELLEHPTDSWVNLGGNSGRGGNHCRVCK